MKFTRPVITAVLPVMATLALTGQSFAGTGAGGTDNGAAPGQTTQCQSKSRRSCPVKVAGNDRVIIDGVAMRRRVLRFKRGTSSGVVTGGVARGERDIITFGARAGQQMSVSIRSLENNAVFQIYAGPVGGRVLAGAGEMDDATRWSGQLPVSARYNIVIGATRGGTEYELLVSIR